MRDQLRTIGRCNVLILGSSRTTRAHFVAPLGGRRNGNRGWKRNAVTPSLSEQREGSRRRKSCSPILTVATQAVDSQASGGWERTTTRLASGATATFLFLLLPQIIVNAQNISQGDFAALSAVSWVGYLTALIAYIMLLNYFLERRERSGASIQIAGIATNAIVLTQVKITGGLPAAVFYAATALLALSTVMSIFRAQDPTDSKQGRTILRWYTDFLGLVGVSSLAEASASTFFGWNSPVSGFLGLCLAASLLAVDRAGKLKGRWKGVWKGVPAWSATLLFAFQPIAQLAKNFSHPESLAGLSKTTLLLAMVGNGLMVPRALITRDTVWLAGSAWASFTGWFQLFSLFISRSPEGWRYLGGFEMLGATLAYLAYNTFIIRKDLQAKDLPISLGSIGSLMQTSQLAGS